VHITGYEWGMLMALYAFIHVSRALSVLVCWPVLAATGYGVSVREGAVLVCVSCPATGVYGLANIRAVRPTFLCMARYGGLRGAVGLTLALIVEHHNELPAATRSCIVFYTAGIAFLTLFVNGTTTGALLKFLGMIKITDAQIRQSEHILDQVRSLRSRARRKSQTDRPR